MQPKCCIGTTKEMLTGKEEMLTRHQMLVETSATSEKADSKAAALACRTRMDDLSIAESDFEAALDRKSRDLQDKASCMGTEMTQANLRSFRLRTPPRSAVELTSDKEDDPEAALDRVELELKCLQLELQRNKLIAKVRCFKTPSESGPPRGRRITSRSTHSRVEEWVAGQHGVRSSRASQFGGRAVNLAPSIANEDTPTEEPVDVPVMNVEPKRTESPKFGASNAAQVPVMEVSLRSELIAELKQAPKKLYNGEPHLFDYWLHNLQQRIDELQLGPREAMEVLANHSTGKPHKLIKKYSKEVDIDQQKQLHSILNKLRRRFGSSRKIASHLYDQLLRSPEIRGQESDPGVALKLRQFGDLCQTVHFAMGSAPALHLLDDFLGMQPIKNKLPEFAYSSWRRECLRYQEKY
ncbi:uncharacterized protein LOC108682394 [Hyalella azteca]|uniref:Uncharacterized protein LOC108682394 n=1 Tax=Hyalella azteca TaxID=294128 RepID=A0A979FWZ7_HYAAZ|nr:uncharacterized protein LOC108682394 [Hyalella azteca]